MTGAPAIISVAITGSVPRKSDHPALPVSPAEQVESTQAVADPAEARRLLGLGPAPGDAASPWHAGLSRHADPTGAPAEVARKGA